MGSALILEIYRDPSSAKNYFQFLFVEHGVVSMLKMPQCPEGLCELDKFLSRAKELTPIDYDIECGPNTESMAGSSDRE